jgi:hypothetical protein
MAINKVKPAYMGICAEVRPSPLFSEGRTSASYPQVDEGQGSPWWEQNAAFCLGLKVMTL